MTRKYWLLIGVVGIVIWRVWPAAFIFTGLNLRVSDDFSKIDDVVPPKGSPELALSGLSHPMFESEKLWREILTGRRKIIHGHGFSPKRVNIALADAIAAEISDASAFIPWRGPKLCGGYHADYYLRWVDGSEVWEAMICLGCDEAILFHAGQSLRCDLDEGTGERLLAIHKQG